MINTGFEVRSQFEKFGRGIGFIFYRINADLEKEEVVSSIDMVEGANVETIEENEDVPALFTLSLKQAKEMIHNIRAALGEAEKFAPLDFGVLREANANRCKGHFHPVNNWSPTDWATAMAGECGESCNDIKKLRRLARDPESVKAEDTSEYHMRLDKAMEELADMVIYADLLAVRMGRNLGEEVRKKFNKKSKQVGSDVEI